MILYLATQHGLAVAEGAGVDWRLRSQALTGAEVTCLAADGGDALYAGTTTGVHRSTDGGESWTEWNDGLSLRHARWLSSAAGQVFLGTEPAGVFVLGEGGSTWRECPEAAALRDKHQWFLPYSPQAGCIRGFAFHGARAYAAAEVGGALRSDDSGSSWRLCAGSSGDPSLTGPPEPFIYPDVHSIEVHPSSPDLVYAPTGGGFYRSRDGGDTWQMSYSCYVRAAWIDPTDPDHILLGPADWVSRNGRIEVSRDGGSTWVSASAGLAVPWSDYMVERFYPLDDAVLAVLSNGQLVAAPLATLEWAQVIPDVPGINAVVSLG